MNKQDLIKRNLSGLPSNLALSYLSAGSHTGNGKMGEWLIHFARLHELTEIEIDVLSKTVSPDKIQAQHITNPLDKLIEMIGSNLKKNGLAPTREKDETTEHTKNTEDERERGASAPWQNDRTKKTVCYRCRLTSEDVDWMSRRSDCA